MKRDPMVFGGLAVVTIAAAIGSFGALRGTALLAGWSRDMSPLLPVTVDATAAVASRVWLSPETPTDKARRFARSVALGAILVSLLGNGIFHMAQAGYLKPGVWLVISAGGVSPLALAVVAHLAVLRSAVPVPDALPEIAQVPEQALPAVSLPAPHAESAQERVRVAAPTPAEQHTAKPREKRAPRVARVSADTRDWAQLLAAAEEVNRSAITATGRAAGVALIKKQVGVGQARAQQLRDALAAPVDAEQVLLPTIEHANGYALA